MNESTKILSEPIRDELKELIREVMREELGATVRSGTAPKDWLKAKDLAAEYHLPQTWFEERGRRGEIARTKPGRYVLFNRRDVERYLEEHKKENGGS